MSLTLEVILVGGPGMEVGPRLTGKEAGLGEGCILCRLELQDP